MGQSLGNELPVVMASFLCNVEKLRRLTLIKISQAGWASVVDI